MRFRFLAAIATLAIVLTAPVLAHHSLAEYDQNTLVKFSGTILEIAWRNPHSWIRLTVGNTDGTNSSVTIEMAGPAALMRKSFDRALLKVGDTVTLETWKGKDPSITKSFNGRTLTLGDGRQFDVADSWMWQGLGATPPTPTR